MASILLLFIFRIAYFIFISKSYSSYEKNIKAYVTKINNINDIKFKEDINTKNTASLVIALNEKISGLNKIKAQVNSQIPTDKYKMQQQSLLNGIDNNILIFKQVVGILNNPKGSDLDNSAKALANYRDKAKTSYAEVGTLFKISIPDSLQEFIDKIIQFSNENSRINKDNEIKASQMEDFINNMTDVINSFIKLKKDFYTDTVNARNKGNLGDVLISINNNKASFKNVKSSFSKISVPGSEANTTYKSLSSLLSSYDSYLQSISFAVSTEIAKIDSGSSLSSDEIDSIYEDSKTAYNWVNKKYDTFLSDIENLKNQK